MCVGAPGQAPGAGELSRATRLALAAARTCANCRPGCHTPPTGNFPLACHGRPSAACPRPPPPALTKGVHRGRGTPSPPRSDRQRQIYMYMCELERAGGGGNRRVRRGSGRGGGPTRPASRSNSGCSSPLTCAQPVHPPTPSMALSSTHAHGALSCPLGHSLHAIRLSLPQVRTCTPTLLSPQ